MRTNLIKAAAAVISCATIRSAQEKAGQSPAITKIELFGAKNRNHRITDEGLTVLKRHKELISLDVSGTQRR
jgi:hypothetical protein